MANLSVGFGVLIPEGELVFSTSRSGGPGGQAVNKTESRVTLRWNVTTSEALTDGQRQWLLSRLPVTKDGTVVLHVSSDRSQHMNKTLAKERLAHLVRKALVRPKKRKPTKPSRGAKERRLKAKRQSSQKKANRRKPHHDD